MICRVLVLCLLAGCATPEKKAHAKAYDLCKAACAPQAMELWSPELGCRCFAPKRACNP